MDKLWAPWRLTYVAATPAPTDGDACFFCAGQKDTEDGANLLLSRRGLAVVYLNRFPYNNGHLLVAPAAHKARLQDLSDEESRQIHDTLRHMVDLLDKHMKPAGYNIGVNLGRAAGAGVPGHLHWHIVPRWDGDTNFMPVCTDTKVISQSLEALYDLLAASLETEQSS